jgi:hypothetical protein
MVAASAFAGGPDATSTSSEKPMSIQSSGSRVGQPSMPEITFEGKRYMQIENGERFGLQRTGLMAVFDAGSNKRLAIVKIYDEGRQLGVEADIQDVFFIRFELQADKRELLIENERKKRFAYEIDTQRVRPLD